MTRYYHSSKLPNRFFSVSNQLFSLLPLTILALVTYLVSSCEEGPTKIGSDSLPGSDFVTLKSTDTLSVLSYTMFDDSVRTDNPAISYLGQLYDPYFGTTTTEFVSQVRMGFPWDDMPFTIDSVKLFLQFLNVKGGSDVTHTLRISEIANQIYTDSAYYSSRTVDTTDFALTDIELPILKQDTVNNITIKLPVSFGNYLTRDTTQLFYSSTKPDFRSFFKGLYFRLSSGSDPMLVSLSLLSKSSGVPVNYFELYMHDEDGAYKNFTFLLDPTSNKNASFNRFLHYFNTASPGKKIEHINDNYQDTLTYLQSLNGVYTKIIFPGLESMKNDTSLKHIAINKARLTIPLYFDGNLYKASTVPSILRLRYKLNGNRYDVPDYGLNGADLNNFFFSGRIDTVANTFTFNIPTFVQGYLKDGTGEIKPELEIFQGTTGINNVILKANKSKTPVKFDFSYTKF